MQLNLVNLVHFVHFVYSDQGKLYLSQRLQFYGFSKQLLEADYTNSLTLASLSYLMDITANTQLYLSKLG